MNGISKFKQEVNRARPEYYQSHQVLFFFIYVYRYDLRKSPRPMKVFFIGSRASFFWSENLRVLIV